MKMKVVIEVEAELDYRYESDLRHVLFSAKTMFSDISSTHITLTGNVVVRDLETKKEIQI